MQDYEVNGKRYSIVKNPQNFRQTGLATWYDSESGGNSRTASGEPFDAYALAAAHPTLPLPSYVRVTNLSNGRQLVVRVNDRGPYTPGRIIDLTRAAAQSATQQGTAPLAATGQRSGFLGAPSALPAGIVETQSAETATSTVPPAAVGALPAAAGRFMVQVGDIGDAQRAANWQKSLSNRFSGPGRVSANGNLFRVQLGPFQSRQQAQSLVQRLQSEAQQPAFDNVTTDAAGRRRLTVPGKRRLNVPRPAQFDRRCRPFVNKSMHSVNP